MNSDDLPLSPLSEEYLEALIASGLVHGVDEPTRLKPLRRELDENEVLCKPGDSADCLWVVVNGTLAVRSADETIVVRTRNSVVGEQALIDDVGRRRANLVASHGPVEVLEIQKLSIDSHPNAARIWRNCAWILCNSNSLSR